MENLPSSLYTNPSSSKALPLSSSVAEGSGGCNAVVQAASDIKMTSAEHLVLNLCNSELRGNALLELSKVSLVLSPPLCRLSYRLEERFCLFDLSGVKREMFKDLAPLLWYSFGTVAALLQEIVSVYPALSSPTLPASTSNRVCNALALLQCIASHPETRIPFIKAQIPHYLYPFLNTPHKAKPFEYLRLTSLGVLGALVKGDDTEVINFLIQSEVVPLCLQTMENGSELSKTVSTFIIQKILLDDAGLQYICATADRFFSVASVLGTMVMSLVEQPSTRLIKHAIRCYLRMSDNPRARMALQMSLPEVLKDGTFDNCLREDSVARQWRQQLLDCLFGGSAGGAHPSPDHAAGGSTGGASQAGPSRPPGI
ncbi:hypothetical protein ACP70R_014504 [Stipagrostis hirtigluma subsp. patula]